MPAYYEFFAGGGLVRAGLGGGWRCLFANDIDEKKSAAYRANWGSEQLRTADVAALTTLDLPSHADLAWASFPCQDLSLAGNQAGLSGDRSGTFWSFWRLMRALAAERRAPGLIVLENVCGALTSHGGQDFTAIAAALADGEYRFGALVMDAVHFVPQSRPRLFIVAVRNGRDLSELPAAAAPNPLWHPANLVAAYARLPDPLKRAWMWWSVAAPPARQTTLSALIEEEPRGVRWHTASETRRLLALMDPIHRDKVEVAQRTGGRIIGAVYKRTRQSRDGHRAQRAEVRFDDVAGCLRTPSGGSSRQTILIVEGDRIRSRLLSPREAARLMGLPDTYNLPENYNEAYHVTGDGVVVPVVRHLADHLLEPLLAAPERR